MKATKRPLFFDFLESATASALSTKEVFQYSMSLDQHIVRGSGKGVYDQFVEIDEAGILRPKAALHDIDRTELLRLATETQTFTDEESADTDTDLGHDSATFLAATATLTRNTGETSDDDSQHSAHLALSTHTSTKTTEETSDADSGEWS